MIQIRHVAIEHLARLLARPWQSFDCWLRDAAGRDTTWLIALTASYLLMLVMSWQRWARSDRGHRPRDESAAPAPERRAASTLDVRHIYGPLSPWLHAGLYRLFGPSLTILYADGIVSATIVLGCSCTGSGRQIMGPAASGVATLHVMSLCMFKPAGNYILPYLVQLAARRDARPDHARDARDDGRNGSTNLRCPTPGAWPHSRRQVSSPASRPSPRPKWVSRQWRRDWRRPC